MRKLIIAVDGTAGSGKSVTFQQVAHQLNYEFIDTGLMYRAFTLLGIWQQIDFSQPQQIIDLIPLFDYQVKKQRVYLNGTDVTNQLPSTQILNWINQITIIPEVRTMMVAKQQKLVKHGGVIMVGRDITSVVLPNADLKIFLDSSVTTRAQRRFEQNQATEIADVSLDEIKKAIKERDHTDQNRAVGALKITPDAWYIDNSNLTIDQVVMMVVEKVKKLEESHG